MSDELHSAAQAERSLTDDQVRFFNAFGFVVLRQHFTPVEMATIKAELAHASDVTFQDAPFDKTVQSSESLHEVKLSASTTPLIYSLPEGPHFYGIAKQLFGKDVIGHESSAVLFVGDTRWHADRSGPDVQISKFGCKFAIYTEPLNADTGALRVLPGSYHQPLSDGLKKIPGIADPENIGDYPGHVCHTEPGDVVLFYLNCWHASRGGKPGRPLLDVVYYAYPKTPQHLKETRFTYARNRQMSIENALSQNEEPPSPTIEEYLTRGYSPQMKTWVVDRAREFGFFDFDRKAYIEECLSRQ